MDEFVVGDRVIVSALTTDEILGYSLHGHTGTVVGTAANIRMLGVSPSIGVAIDPEFDFTGHDCNGATTCCNGWYFISSELEKL